ncbi:MAG TPA: hypothetical protein VNH21_12950 [Steroidobacteraceae bacterium]|nr:hypothetical protein [Steroidobacteraceae bacterium]
MNEMVERLALLLTRAKVGFESAEVPVDAARRLARTFFAAMREPTEAMLECAGSVEDYTDRDNIFAHAWRAMIDAALEE